MPISLFCVFKIAIVEMHFGNINGRKATEGKGYDSEECHTSLHHHRDSDSDVWSWMSLKSTITD